MHIAVVGQDQWVCSFAGQADVYTSGQGRGGMNRFMTGYIDEARIYYSAKTAAQIQTDMNTPIPGSPLGANGAPTISDVQSAVNQTIGTSSCSTADVNGDGSCTIVDIQRIINAVLGL